jgi:hypothetical protein
MASIKVVVVIKPRADGEQGPVGVRTDVPGQVQLTCLRGKAHNGKVALCEDSHTGRVGTLFELSGLKRELDDLAAARRAGAHLAASPDLVVIAYGRSGAGKTQALFGDGSEQDMPGLGGLIGCTLVEVVGIARVRHQVDYTLIHTPCLHPCLHPLFAPLLTHSIFTPLFTPLLYPYSHPHPTSERERAEGEGVCRKSARRHLL